MEEGAKAWDPKLPKSDLVVAWVLPSLPSVSLSLSLLLMDRLP